MKLLELGSKYVVFRTTKLILYENCTVRLIMVRSSPPACDHSWPTGSDVWCDPTGAGWLCSPLPPHGSRRQVKDKVLILNCTNSCWRFIFKKYLQCCGSGINYSGSSYEFFEFRILPMHLSIFDNYYKKHLKFNQKEESTGYRTYLLLFSISYYSPTVHSPEFTCLKLEEFFYLFICFFIFCWIPNNIFDSGSSKKFRIPPDPDL